MSTCTNSYKYGTRISRHGTQKSVFVTEPRWFWCSPLENSIKEHFGGFKDYWVLLSFYFILFFLLTLALWQNWWDTIKYDTNDVTR